MLNYIILFIFILINIAMAWYEAFLRRQDILHGTTGSIKHGIWALIYILLVVIAFFISDKNYILVIVLFISRIPIFDISFNLFSRLPIFYKSTTTTSIVDKINNFIFHGNPELYEIFYTIASIILSFYF